MPLQGGEAVGVHQFCFLVPFSSREISVPLETRASPGKAPLWPCSLPRACSRIPFPAEGSPHPGKAAHGTTASLPMADSAIIWLPVIAH